MTITMMMEPDCRNESSTQLSVFSCSNWLATEHKKRSAMPLSTSKACVSFVQMISLYSNTQMMRMSIRS